MPAPACPFGSPWESLTLNDIKAFLAKRPPERTIWEAKSQGNKAQVADAVRKETCGFSNHKGGYLLLGAEEQPDGTWTLPGIELKGIRELHDWIASLLRDLTPPPLFDVHEWALTGGAKVAVLQVEPAALPPVSHNGVTYIRHGSQTLRADGDAIRRLSQAGQRAANKIAKAARDEANKSVDQIWVPFGVAVARAGERGYALSDSKPEQVLYDELEAKLQGRYRKRTLTRMVWDDPSLHDYTKLGIKPRPRFRGWRAAWQTEQTDRAPTFPARGHGRIGDRPKVNAALTDRDLWFAHVMPANLISGAVCHLPVRRHPMEREYGDRAIASAALVLRALLATERHLGLRDHEQLFIALALREHSGGPPVIIERQLPPTLNVADWRADVTVEAGKKMHL